MTRSATRIFRLCARPGRLSCRGLSITGVGAAILLAACGTDSDTGSFTTDPSPAPSRVPWSGAPTDGTWASGDVSFGQPTPLSEGPLNEYSFAIVAPPTLTTADNGKTVTMTSTMNVHRVRDKGFNEDISEANFFAFNPGVLPGSVVDMNEDYGEDTDVQCQNDRPRPGETTTCTLAFTAPADEIANSYWSINDYSVGAWPSQIAQP